MSQLVHMVVENYHDLLESRKDPVVETWWLMSTPWPAVGLLLAYLYFVLKLGPRLMEKRKPFILKWPMIAYNAYQVGFSMWLCGQAVYSRKFLHYFFNSACKTTEREFQLEVSRVAWWYFFSKVVEFLDTIFFVLRKKQSQVTFLHVYHHSATMIFSWGYLRFLPGEQGVLIGFLNCLVHIVMYTYYLIAAMGPQFHKYLWWKRYMTWIQLTQFCIMLAYLVYIISLDCKQLSRGLTFFFVANVIIYLYLFSDFYRKAYIKNKKSKITEDSRTNSSIDKSQ